MQEWRRGGGEEKGGEDIYRVAYPLGGKTLCKIGQFKFFFLLKFSGPLSRTSAELGLVAPFLHPYWIKSCFRPNPLSLIG